VRAFGGSAPELSICNLLNGEHTTHFTIYYIKITTTKKEREKKRLAHKTSPFCANVGKKIYARAARLLPLLRVFRAVLGLLVA